jgi:hypothetical protein
MDIKSVVGRYATLLGLTAQCFNHIERNNQTKKRLWFSRPVCYPQSPEFRSSGLLGGVAIDIIPPGDLEINETCCDDFLL